LGLFAFGWNSGEEDMTKDELVAKVAEQTTLKKTDVQKTLDSMIETIIHTIQGGEKVNITNLVFSRCGRRGRVARNPKTGETIQVPAKNAPKFIPSKHLKEAVN
jgi:nucleoid DNA-binding protein